jgi:hypothetical protein
LGEQLVQGIAAALLGLDDDTAAFHCDTDLGTGLQVQDIEQGARDGQHNGAANFAQIRGVHWLYLDVTFSTSHFAGLVSFVRAETQKPQKHPSREAAKLAKKLSHAARKF